MKHVNYYGFTFKFTRVKLFVFLFFSFASLAGNAQVFWTESFNNGCSANCGASTYVGPNGPWTVTSTGPEGAEPNNWYVSCAENGHTAGICGTGCVPASATATLATLHVGADPSFIGDIGAAYDAGGLCGILTCPQTDRRAESPVISTVGKTGITLAFNYIANGNPGTDFATIMFSTNSGATWSLLTTPAVTPFGGCAPQGQWTAFSMLLPATCDNIATLKIGFRWVNNDDGVGTDPSFAVDEVTLSVPSVNSITTGTITGSPFCACSAMNVPFTSTGTYTAGNTYTAQLSNAAGSFAAPVNIGTLVSVANAGVIACTIPCGTPTGSGYRIRVISSTPPVTGSDNGVNITINTEVVPSVSISATSTSICTGGSVTFTATPTNGGAGPTYQWQVNGVDVFGATSTTFTTTTLVNGDVVSVTMVSNALCATPATVVSNTILITVTAILPASVSITSTGATICAGDPVVFTATPTNGGTTPTYQWQINGTNVGGATSSTFTSSTLVNGDVVTVIMTSSLACVSGSPATSNSITITVAAVVPASVSISASPGIVVCVGDLVTFTATPTNGGATPTYQWQLNGTNIGGATSSTFSSSTLVTGDVITVIMTSSLSCATGSPATSNTLTMTVTPTVAASVSIVGAPLTICIGDPVTFTATPTNGGTTPSYQWQINGVNAGPNSPTFTSTGLANGDVITVIMTSSFTCATGSPATSNSLSVVVNSCTPPVANFTANQTVFCATPACVNFTDLSTNTPTSWSWSFPGGSPASSTSQNPTNICYSANGSYDVVLIATNADGSDTLTQIGYITVGAPVTVTVSGNLVINACESTTLYASPSDGTYSWSPGISTTGPEATVSPTVTTDYTVEYTSPQGCTDTETVTVVVENIFTYYMPTGLSPNGDGINDVIQVHGRGIDYISLKIFDRIGEKVFETSDPSKAWDGKLLGLRMNDNVFVYDLVVVFCDGSEAKEHGAIMLAR